MLEEGLDSKTGQRKDRSRYSIHNVSPLSGSETELLDSACIMHPFPVNVAAVRNTISYLDTAANFLIG